MCYGQLTIRSLAEWTYIDLHPAGARSSEAYAAGATRQAGVVETPLYHAGTWIGSAESWIDLTPGFDGGRAYAVDGDVCAGTRSFFQLETSRAAMWSGGPGSYVDLNPAGAFSSYIYAAANGQQVGSAAGGTARACLWHGTAQSWVTLDFGGDSEYSLAYGTDGTQQCGLSGRRACMWRGTAESRVLLHPTGAFLSTAYSTAGGQQAGSVRWSSGSWEHACIWNGSSQSLVDLNPPGAARSVAYSTCGSRQAGETGFSHACVWTGTPESCEDLHAVLPLMYTSSGANSIFQSGDRFYVAGYATVIPNNDRRAMLWIWRPPCSGDLNGDRHVNVSDLLILLAHFGNTGAASVDGDLDGDADVDLRDLADLLHHFGTNCA